MTPADPSAIPAEAAVAARRAMRLTRPRTPNQLHAYIRTVLGFLVPRRPIVDGHQPPFDYVQHAFFEDRQPRDCIVWANRGGGKYAGSCCHAVP